MDTSLDIVLGALDGTRPAIDSAAGGFNYLRNVIAQVGTEMEASLSFNVNSAGMTNPLRDIADVAAITTAAIAGIGLAITGVAIAVPVLGTAAGTVAASVWTSAQILGESITDAGNATLATFEAMINGSYDWDSSFDSVVRSSITALATLEFGFKHLHQIIDYSIAGAALTIEAFKQQMKGLAQPIETWWTRLQGDFKEKGIGGMADIGLQRMTWFADSWATNIINAGHAAIDKVAGDGSFQFKWQTVFLPEMEKNFGKEFTDKIASAITPTEMALAEQFNQLGDDLGEGLTSHIAKRLEQLPYVKKQLSDFGKDAMGLFKDFGPMLAQLFGFGMPAIQQQIKLNLPSANTDRYTTGVGDAAKERQASYEAEMRGLAKRQTGAIELIAQAIAKSPLPQSIKDGVKAGVEAAKTVGVPGFGIKP